mmetsp:Transcript_45237/g.147009  ORF Transcript_45237/g.147009 Transcript_45237/m.147009 type:complete len:158 (-) Transcript_45237:175-648(-)
MSPAAGGQRPAVRELLINDVMSKLQAVEEELAFLSSCERSAVSSGQGIVCPAKGTPAEVEELASCLAAAGTAFDRYFDVVPAADARAAMGIVTKTNPRWELLPLERSGEASSSGSSSRSSGSSEGGSSSSSSAGGRQAMSLRMTQTEARSCRHHMLW